jgi:hypothetical protein
VFFNPLLFMALILGALLFLVGFRLTGNQPLSLRVLIWPMAVLLTMPALAFTAYYLHLVKDTPTYISLRSLPGIEVMSGGIGLLAGLLTRSLKLPHRWKWLPAFLCAGLLLAPFLKPLLLPVTLQGQFQDRWSDGVCLQSGNSTCGPASLNTLLAMHGEKLIERDTARKSYSSLTGTEIWYLIRMARHRGFLVAWGDAATLAEAPVPAIIGTTMTRSGAGHFITLLGYSPDRLEIGDPLVGRIHLTPAQFAQRYRFTGRWMTIARGN